MCNGDESRPDLKLDHTPILLRKDQSSKFCDNFAVEPRWNEQWQWHIPGQFRDPVAELNQSNSGKNNAQSNSKE